MGSLSVTARDHLLDHIFNSEYTKPSVVYFCLCTANPTENGEGDDMNETADAGGYARQAIRFSAASSRKIVQSARITFPKVTATYSAPVTHWAICSSGSYGGGDMLAYGALDASVTPLIDKVYIVEAEEIEISIEEDADYGFTDYAVHLMLNIMFRNQTWSTPKDSLYIALATAAIEHDVADTSEISEETATDYARVKVDAWIPSDAGYTENEANITMVTSIATADWGSDVASAIVLAGGTTTTQVLCYDNASIPEQSPTTGDSIIFDAGDFVVELY